MAWTVFAAFVFQCVCSLAQSPEQIQKARAFVIAGLAKQQENRHEEAIALFDDALRIVPHPKFKYFKANSLKALGRGMQALELYQQIAADPRVGTKYQKDIQESIKVLREQLGPVKVRITTGSVSGAEVHVDGRRVGTTPYETELPQQKYRVRVVKEGYQPVEKSLEVKGKAPVVLDVRLHEVSECRLLVQCNVAGAAIQIDGKQVAATPQDKPLLLKPGHYLMSVTKPGYKSWEKKTFLGSGPKELTVHLEKLPAHAQTRETSPPPEATVVKEAAPRTAAVWKWLTIGLGVAIAAGGAGLQASAASLSSDANDLDPASFDTFDSYDAEYVSQFSSAKDRMKGAYAMYAIGGAAVVGGILWLVLDRPSKKARTAVLRTGVGDRSVVIEATVSF